MNTSPVFRWHLNTRLVGDYIHMSGTWIATVLSFALFLTLLSWTLSAFRIGKYFLFFPLKLTLNVLLTNSQLSVYWSEIHQVLLSHFSLLADFFLLISHLSNTLLTFNVIYRQSSVK